jgi:hypothetical protein
MYRVSSAAGTLLIKISGNEHRVKIPGRAVYCPVRCEYGAGQFTARFVAKNTSKTPGASSRAKHSMRHLLPEYQ